MNSLKWMTIAIVFITLASVSLSAYFSINDSLNKITDYPIIFAIMATGIIGFFGILIHYNEASDSSDINDRNIRLALTISIIMSYLVFIGYAVFYETELSEIAETAIGSFSAVVATVIAFYFGSSVYLSGKVTDGS